MIVVKLIQANTTQKPVSLDIKNGEIELFFLVPRCFTRQNKCGTFFQRVVLMTPRHPGEHFVYRFAGGFKQKRNILSAVAPDSYCVVGQFSSHSLISLL